MMKKNLNISWRCGCLVQNSLSQFSTNNICHTKNGDGYEAKNVDDLLSMENELRSIVSLTSGEQDDMLTQSSALMSRQLLMSSRKKNLQRAGILVPLCIIDNEPSVLFTLRTTFLGSHKGEVSFPGGGADKSDKDIIDTALRETCEEIGLRADGINVWGTGASVPSRDFTKIVVPVIANCGFVEMNELTPNPKEVEEIFPVKLSQLCDSDNWAYTRFLVKVEQHGQLKRPSYVMPVFTGAKYRIWGLTAIFTYLTMSTVAKGLFEFKLP